MAEFSASVMAGASPLPLRVVAATRVSEGQPALTLPTTLRSFRVFSR